MNKGLFIAILAMSSFAATAALANPLHTNSLSPYDVVVPSLNGDPSSSDRVSGQLYYDVSTSNFKGIDNSGAVKTFVTNGPNLIKSNGTNQRIESLTVSGACTSSPCTVSNSSSSWFTSVSHTGTGLYSVAFSTTSGTSFSNPPTCTVSPETGGAALGVEGVQTSSSTLTFTMFTNGGSVGPVPYDAGFQIICMGPSN